MMTRLDWDTEVRPVLVAAYRAFGKAGSAYPDVQSQDINAELGRPPDDERQSIALEYLQKAEYISGRRTMGGSWHFVTLEDRGLVEVAGWPAAPGQDYGAKLLDLLEERIKAADDEGERTRLQRLRDTVVEIGTNVVSGVLTDLARRSL
jgi:hypothetical protein